MMSGTCGVFRRRSLNVRQCVLILTTVIPCAVPALAQVPLSPIIGVLPLPLDFGTVPVGSLQDITAQIFNQTPDPASLLRVTQITVAGTGFSLQSGPTLPVTIPGDGTQVPVTVRFAPTAEGAATGTLTVTASNALTSIQSLLAQATVELPSDLPCAQTMLVIAGNKELVHQTGADSLHYREGDRVITAYVAGMLTLNGRPLQQPVPERLRPVERLRGLYGDIPFIQAHLAANPVPDSTLRWNQAFQAMVKARRQAITSAESAFAEARRQGLGLDDAAQRAATVLSGYGDIVASATVAPERPGMPSPRSRRLLVHWLGSYEEFYELPPRPERRTVQAGDTISPDGACALIRTLRRVLEEPSGIAGRVELNNGNVNILGEALTLLARQEGR